MNSIPKYIFLAITVFLSYGIGAWLYQKGSQVLFNQTIHHSEYRGIVITSFFLYLMIIVPVIILSIYVINRSSLNTVLKWLLALSISVGAGLIFPFLASGRQLASPEGQLLLIFFIPSAIVLGIICHILFLNKPIKT
ncbi:hypothetical protein [Paenibacillus illinoisensis]|uniref:hypothetical protein n=1 Tax=Paenibacillus illinoisensis TaxID=59845 RepID=UPI0036F31D2C